MNKLFALTVAMALSVYCYSQISISGTVKDSLDKPIPGATVKVENTFKGTVTDNNGYFELKNLSGECKLTVSYIGFETYRLNVSEVNAGEQLDIQLKASNESLNEFTVTATRVKENSPIAHTNVSKNE